MLAFFLATVVFGAAPPAAPAAAASQPARALNGLLSDLAHPRFAVREQATRDLCGLDAGVLPQLVARYRAETRFEPKRRLRYIIEYIFDREQIVGHNGFMGVEVWPRMIDELLDPVAGKPARGVLVRDVKRGFAAERAGLRGGDVMVALDGKPLPEDPTTASFIQAVSSHPPGAAMGVRLLRPRTRVEQIEVRAAEEPSRTLEGVKFEASLPDTSQGAWVVSVPKDSPAAVAGLQANQVIRLVSVRRAAGVPQVSHLAPAQLPGLLQMLRPGDVLNLEVARSDVVELTVRLGARPPEFIDLRDKLEVQARFLQWWQEQGGDVSVHPEEQAATRIFFPREPPRVSPEASLLP